MQDYEGLYAMLFSREFISSYFRLEENQVEQIILDNKNHPLWQCFKNLMMRQYYKCQNTFQEIWQIPPQFMEILKNQQENQIQQKLGFYQQLMLTVLKELKSKNNEVQDQQELEKISEIQNTNILTLEDQQNQVGSEQSLFNQKLVQNVKIPAE